MLRSTIQALEDTASGLRALALRMDSRGELSAKQVHEQAREAEARAKRIRELLEKQPVWPPRLRGPSEA
jgi:hypothetical protein